MSMYVWIYTFKRHFSWEWIGFLFASWRENSLFKVHITPIWKLYFSWGLKHGEFEYAIEIGIWFFSNRNRCLNFMRLGKNRQLGVWIELGCLASSWLQLSELKPHLWHNKQESQHGKAFDHHFCSRKLRRKMSHTSSETEEEGNMSVEEDLMEEHEESEEISTTEVCGKRRWTSWTIWGWINCGWRMASPIQGRTTSWRQPFRQASKVSRWQWTNCLVVSELYFVMLNVVLV